MSTAPTKPAPASRIDPTGLRRLARLAAPEAKWLALGIFFLIIASSSSLVFPQAIRYLLDEAFGAGDVAKIDRAALLLVVVFAVQGVASAARYVTFTLTGERIVTRLRRHVFESLLRQEIAFFDARKTGELTSRLSSDTTVIQSAVSANISMALRNLASALGGVVLLIYTSPRLAAVMLAIVPPVALSAVYYGRRVRRMSRDAQDALARASEVAEESLSGIRTVRSFDAETMEGARYGAAVQDSYLVAKNRAFLAGTVMGIAQFAAFGAAAVVLWYGGRLVIAHELSVGALTSFLVYSMLVAFSLGALSDVWADLMKALGATERVFELLDREPTIHPETGQTLPNVEGRIAFEDVHFTYPTRPDTPVLRGVSLAADRGDVIALVGPSGAGKSTIAQLLARLYDPDQGRITLDDHDLRALDPRWLHRNVGTVAQEPILFSSSIAENIRYGKPAATDEEIESAARAANAHTFIQAFPDGYKTLVGERGIQLSGGQKQRVAIARALLKDPPILVLDEATSALDAESEHLVQEALVRLMQGRTTLVIAHRLSTVVGAQRVLVIDGGQIVQSGNHATLLREDGLYKKLVEKQLVRAA